MNTKGVFDAYNIVDYFAIVTFILLAIGLSFLAAYVPGSLSFVLPVLFGPFGAIARFYMATHFNRKVEHFPLGTFAVNVAGSGLLAVCYTISIYQPVTTIDCDFLVALMDGFCGSLTTISTFVAELSVMSTKHASIYGYSSIGGAQLLILIVYIVNYSIYGAPGSTACTASS